MSRQPLKIEFGGKQPKSIPEELTIEVPHPLIPGRVDMYQVNTVIYNKHLGHNGLVVHWDNGKTENIGKIHSDRPN